MQPVNTRRTLARRKGQLEAEEKKKRGRPPGSRNKGRLVPRSDEPLADYRHADPDAIINRQFQLLDWAQQALRNEIKSAFGEHGKSISSSDIGKLSDLSNAIVRACDALKKHNDLADELEKRLSGGKLLEAALRKIEGQDLATVRYAIKRLRAYLETMTPDTREHDRGTTSTIASSAIASLDDNDDDADGSDR